MARRLKFPNGSLRFLLLLTCSLALLHSCSAEIDGSDGEENAIAVQAVSNAVLFCIVVGVILLAYVAHYNVKVCSKPQLVTRQNSALHRFLVRHCAFATEKYAPPIWCYEGRMQTALRSVLCNCVEKIPYRRVTLQLTDGGELIIDWVDNELNNKRYPNAETRPTVLLLPGLTGHSEEGYVKSMIIPIQDRGYRVVAFNYRGTGEATLRTPKFYCASNVQDLCTAIDYIQSCYPRAPLIAAGVSLGGMILFNYLAHVGRNCNLVAAFISSAAWDVSESARNLEGPLNWFLFNRYLASLLVHNVMRNMDVLKPTGKYNMDRVLRSKSIREFDNHFTSRMFGYTSAEDYYKDSTLNHKLHRVEVPVVSLSAADDPFAPRHSLPLDSLSRSDRVAMVLTSHGGHIGFMEGVFMPRSTLLERAVAQYAEAVFENIDEWRQITKATTMT